MQPALRIDGEGFGALVALQLARTELAQSYEVGLIQQTPVPELSTEAHNALGELARTSWSQKRRLDTNTENSHAFQIPALLQVKGESLGDRATTWSDHVSWTEARLASLQMQINDCRENRMGAEKWKRDGGDMINMEALLASVSRGLPVNVAIDGPAQSTWEQGKELYYARTGQLELSCANCHEDNYGNMIRADHLSQGQINGFPVYRLKNTKLNGVQSRFKGCVRDTRAETYAVGSPEFLALELYVASRGNGLSIEGPSVRN